MQPMYSMTASVNDAIPPPVRRRRYPPLSCICDALQFRTRVCDEKDAHIEARVLSVRDVLWQHGALVATVREGDLDSIYYRYEIRTTNGKVREIYEPFPALKVFQRKLAAAFHFAVHPNAHGFVPARSVLTNANAHRDAKHFLNLDVRAFFQSITLQQVGQVFHNTGLGDFSTKLLKLVMCGGLPTGAPTSPVVANAVFYPIDEELALLARSLGLVYSRYVDDLTFSSQDYVRPDTLAGITAVIERHGFKVNERKTRFVGPRQSPRVTGLIVRHDSACHGDLPRVPRKVMRFLRAGLHAELVAAGFIKTKSITGRLQVVGPVHNSLATERVIRALSALSPRLRGYRAWISGINLLQASRIDRWLASYEHLGKANSRPQGEQQLDSNECSDDLNDVPF